MAISTSRKGLNRLLKQVKTGDWLSELIDRIDDQERAEKWNPPTLEIHPSSAGNACPRDIQLSLLGHRTGTAPLNRRRMDNGTDAHKRWGRDLAKTGALDSEGVRLKLVGEWSGEYDLMVRNPSTGTKHIGEIKTMNFSRYNSVPPQHEDLTQMALILEASERGYVYQIIHYLVKFGERDPKISPVVFFLFEDTNSQNYKVRWFRPDEAMKARAFKNSTEARNATIKGELIPPPFMRNSMTCRACYRQSVCYKLQDGDPETMEKLNEAFLKLGQSPTLVITAEPRIESTDEDVITW